VTTERTTPLPDIEALSRNASLLVEEFGRAASRYMKPVGTPDALPVEAVEPPEEVKDVVRTLGSVAETWLADPKKTVEAQTKLSEAFITLWG